MATGALLNALWDLWAKAERKPLWKLLVDLTPEQLVATIDFSYLSDALTPRPRPSSCCASSSPRARNAKRRCAREGYPAYTTSTGWLGYTDEKVRRLCEEAVAAGWTDFKMKVGQDLEANRAAGRAHAASIIGPDRKLMMDANQCWDVPEAIRQMQRLAEFDPWWIEEPTSPDDVLGHAAIARAVAPIRVATGEACQNRVIFKQLLQADAIGFCQVDSCRVGGVNEVALGHAAGGEVRDPGLPARGRRRPVRVRAAPRRSSTTSRSAAVARGPRAASTWTICTSTSWIPVRIVNGRYAVPTAPGYSITMKAASLDDFEFPCGREWRGAEAVTASSPRP